MQNMNVIRNVAEWRVWICKKEKFPLIQAKATFPINCLLLQGQGKTFDALNLMCNKY